ncbi:MAG: prefoldin subunit alpha [Sulfolobales archaeon]
MSDEKTSQRDQRIEALVAELGRVEEYIKVLQQNLGVILQEIEEIRLAREALEGIKTYQSQEVLIGVDRRGHIYIKGSIVSRDVVLTHIGGEYLTELPVDQALKILDEKESDLRKALESLTQEISEARQVYERLYNTLNTLIAERGKEKKS